MALKFTVRNTLYVFGSIIIILVFFTFLYNQSRVLSDSEKCKLYELDSSREIIETNIDIHELWSVTGIPVENFESKDLMVSVSGSVIIASTGCDTVIALDTLSGDLRWEHTPVNPDNRFNYGDLHQPRNLTLDSTRHTIYVSATNEIRAISVNDGSMLWSNVSDNFERNAHSVIIDEDGQLTVSAKGSWYIHPETGELSEFPISIPVTDIQPEIDSEALQTVNETDDFYPISNIAITDERVFVLDEIARLHIFNRNSSVANHTVQFSIPEKTELLYAPGAIGGSWIAVDDDVIVVYFQDTDILSAYQILDEDFN